MLGLGETGQLLHGCCLEGADKGNVPDSGQEASLGMTASVDHLRRSRTSPRYIDWNHQYKCSGLYTTATVDGEMSPI